MAWTRHARLACGLALAGTLAACGGSDDGAAASGGQNPPSPSTQTPATASKKVLLVGVDGATYSALQSALLAHALPNLGQLTLMPSATGGTLGTVTEQAPLDAPSWATVLSGTWRNRHGIADDSASQLQAPTLFARLRSAAGSARQAGAATSSMVMPGLLKSDQASGALNTLVDCAGADDCVTQNSLRLVRAGYDTVFAHYTAPAAAAAAAGLESSAYTSALVSVDAALGKLLAAVAERRKANPGEDWLVLVTASHGLDDTGATTSVPMLENRTAFIALNKALNADLTSPGGPAPTNNAQLAALPSGADIAPTLLDHVGVRADAASNATDGASLIASATGVRGIATTVGRYGDALLLNWQNPSAASGSMTLLRDGKTVATLPAGTTQYNDSGFDLASGLYRFNYTLVRNGVPTSYLAQMNYIRPTPLATTLTNNLALYYSFDKLPPVDVKGASTLGPWIAGTDGGSASTDNFGSGALKVDSRIDAYKLAFSGTDLALSPQFTMGFWFKTDCTQGNGTGEPILSNKDYYTGSNPGIAIALWGSCELRFNIGSGGKRDDITGMKVSANQWAYVALSINATAKTFSAYIIDPVLGLQKTENKAIANTDVSKLGGLGTKTWGVNDDATHNYVANNPGSLKGVMEFNDLAIWTRTLTLDELKSIPGSRQPISSLQP